MHLLNGFVANIFVPKWEYSWFSHFSGLKLSKVPFIPLKLLEIKWTGHSARTNCEIIGNWIRINDQNCIAEIKTLGFRCKIPEQNKQKNNHIQAHRSEFDYGENFA